MLKFLISVLFLTVSLFSFDVSTATEKEFLSLKGIGKVLAKRIIEYRAKNGLKSIDDLIHVKGVGKRKLAKIKESLNANSKTQSKSKSQAKIDLTKYKK